MSRKHQKRRLRNYLLDPLLQVKLGLYAIVLALAFCSIMVGAFYSNFYKFYDLVLELTDLREEVTQILNSYLEDMIVWTVLGTLVYFVLMVTMSIFYTHRLVGPTYAFRRHIRELVKGNYKSRVSLRKSDAFSHIAEELNELAATLETRAASKNSQI